MLGFWEAKMRNRKIFVYSLAPFLEEAAILLLAAKRLWHPWSVKRLEELERIACDLKDRARFMRQCGLGWAGNISKFGEEFAGLLALSVYHRYHSRDGKAASPSAASSGPNGPSAMSSGQAAAYLVSAAVRILFLLRPVFQKIEELSWEEKGWTKWLSQIIETLMESPCLGSEPEITDEMIKIIAEQAVLLECEGLCHMQAEIEDSFNKRNKSAGLSRPGGGRKKSDLSEAELRNLAAEIDLPFETVKEVFETEYSSWRDQAKQYRDQAQTRKEIFISLLPTEDHIKSAIADAWDIGWATQKSQPDCWSETEVMKAEKIIKTFIAMFTAHLENPLKLAPNLTAENFLQDQR